MCAAPKQGPQSLPAGVDLEKETVITGKVVDGMNTVDAIRAVKTGQKMANTRGGQGPMGDVPMETVEIIKVVEIPAPAGK
ncbi:MAG: DUF1416 domain-containing protein [Mycobacteriaceae bacterium]|nr:DUF1416 domain-containing protein [Mycobacteriaceae bacterium]